MHGCSAGSLRWRDVARLHAFVRAGKRDARAGALVSALACGSGMVPLDQLALVWEAVAHSRDLSGKARFDPLGRD